MVQLRKPSSRCIRDFLDEQRSLEICYAEIGAAAGQPPPGYHVDHTRVLLGSGADVFERARTALQQWQQFQLGWVEAFPDDTRIVAGECVAIVARVTGLWWLNACRIVSAIDDRRPPARFGFTYATLPGHVETGEERFLVECDAQDSVWYDILAISRPRHLLAWLGYPIARRYQRRFARDSAAAMKRSTGFGRTDDDRIWQPVRRG